MKRSSQNDFNPSPLKLKKPDEAYYESLKDKMENGSEEEILNLINYISVTQLLAIKDERLGGNVFLWAASRGFKEVITQILSIDSNMIDTFLSLRLENGSDAFLLTAESGHLELLEYLLELKPEFIDSIDKDGCNAFLLAASKGRLEVMEYLLQLQPEFINSISSIRGNNAFLIAAIYGHLDVIKYLLQLKPEFINSSNKNESNAFLLAAWNGNLDVMRYL
ncbi:hypothetical protein NF27_BP00040, partial [Candidatus Jidaibacter acanthamoeba]